MTPSEFSALAAAGYNRIPVYRDVIADLDTPLSTYLKLADGPYSYLLESAQGGEKWGRFSILGLPCSTVLKVNDKTVTIEDNGRQTEQHQVDDPLSFIEQFQARYKVAEVPGLPRFVGGLVGYFGYDTMRYVEPRMAHSTPPDTINTPDILLMVSNDVIVFDSLKGILTLVTHADPAEKNALEKAQTRLDLLSMRLREAVPAQSYSDRPAFDLNEVDFVSSFGEQEFHQSVDKIKDYIVQGDVMQVVISQRKSCDINCQPIEIYRALRNLNPSPYMYFMNFGDFHIVSSSPEILAHLDNGEVTVRPLAGTRRRGYNSAEDIALEKELLADPKEIAEHLMLIDLARNDTGRIAQTGTVEVTDQFIVERYSHVMHIASNVIGQIKPGVTAMDVLRATLPVGTLSGAPKIRAMEIIDELEPEKRGVFGGAVGYLAWNGNMDTAIAIRTAVIKDNKLYVQAGAGVVADSIPALEWKETNNKARAIVQAACIAEKGLDYLGLEQQKLNSHHK